MPLGHKLIKLSLDWQLLQQLLLLFPHRQDSNASVVLSFHLVHTPTEFLKERSKPRRISREITINETQWMASGSTCRNIQFDDFFFRNVIQILHKTTQTVPMGRNQNPFAGLNGGSDGVMPVWEHTCNCILQTLGKRKFIGWDVL